MDKGLEPDGLKRDIYEGLRLLKEMVENGKFDMLIMDEILISVRDGYLEESALLDFIRNKPDHLELVLTGRGASPEVIASSQYVTNMQKIKHPYDSGISGRKGVEF